MKHLPQPPTPFPRVERIRPPHENFEYLVVTVAPGQSLSEARRALVEHAEYGKWELRRTVKYSGGGQRFWLRRRLMRVERTLTVV